MENEKNPGSGKRLDAGGTRVTQSRDERRWKCLNSSKHHDAQTTFRSAIHDLLYLFIQGSKTILHFGLPRPKRGACAVRRPLFDLKSRPQWRACLHAINWLRWAAPARARARAVTVSKICAQARRCKMPQIDVQYVLVGVKMRKTVASLDPKTDTRSNRGARRWMPLRLAYTKAYRAGYSQPPAAVESSPTPQLTHLVYLVLSSRPRSALRPRECRRVSRLNGLCALSNSKQLVSRSTQRIKDSRL